MVRGKATRRVTGRDARLKGGFPGGGAFLGGREEQEGEALPPSAAGKVETGGQEEEMSLQGLCCGGRRRPEGV